MKTSVQRFSLSPPPLQKKKKSPGALQGGEKGDGGLGSQCCFHTSRRVSRPNPSPWKPGSVKLAGMSAMQGVNGGRRRATMALESDCSCKRED